MVAAQNQHTAVLDALLRRHANVNTTNAVRGRQLSCRILQTIICRRARPFGGPFQDGWTAVMAAAINGNLELLGSLLEKGSDVDAADTVRDGLRSLVVVRQKLTLC